MFWQGTWKGEQIDLFFSDEYLVFIVLSKKKKRKFWAQLQIKRESFTSSSKRTHFGMPCLSQTQITSQPSLLTLLLLEMDIPSDLCSHCDWLMRLFAVWRFCKKICEEYNGHFFTRRYSHSVWKYGSPQDICLSEQKKTCLWCVKALTVMLPDLDLDSLKKRNLYSQLSFPCLKKGFQIRQNWEGRKKLRGKYWKLGEDGWREAGHQTQAGGEKGALGVTLEGVEKRGNQC